LNVREDLYSDGKEDWLATPALQGSLFPIRPIGGDQVPGRIIGDSYVLENGWHIMPYEADHELLIVGNLFTQFPPLVLDTIGDFTVRVTSEVSTLVEVRETGVSGLTPTESAALLQIAVDLASVDGEVTLMNDGVFGAKRVTKSADPSAGVPGFIELWDRNLVYVGYKRIWEDGAQTIGYRERGIGYETEVLAGSPTWP
jgi:hypothetical protein